MKVETECPRCTERFDVEVERGNEVYCPECGECFEAWADESEARYDTR